ITGGKVEPARRQVASDERRVTMVNPHHVDREQHLVHVDQRDDDPDRHQRSPQLPPPRLAPQIVHPAILGGAGTLGAAGRFSLWVWLLGAGWVTIGDGRWRERCLEPAEATMPVVSANGIEINYEVTGEGEPLVLIPYLAADQACYAFQVADYAKHFTCFSVD